MDRNVQRLEVLNGGSAYGVDTHKVLRNTYWLLSLSLVPTVLGAWIGVQTGAFAHLSMGLSFLVFFGGAMALMFAVQQFRNSAAGVFWLLGFTFFMGLMLSRLLGVVLHGYSNGAELIMTAFGGTAAVFFGMASLATVVKRDLSNLTRFLFVGVLIAIVASLLNAFFVHSSALMLTISTAMTAVFSVFILVDVKRVIDGGETNYIMATLNIYLDLYNLFQNLLVILASISGNRR